MINVMIVDDHPVVADGIQKLLETQPDMNVTATALCGEDCKRLLETIDTDIVLLDINLPDINGMDLCDYICRHHSEVKVIALTGFREFYYMVKMLACGAEGYLLKNALPEEILEGIREVYAGRKYLCDEVEQKFASNKNDSGQLYLTLRERELLKLIVEGYTNKEIADKLFLSVETINGYRKNLLLKLGVKNTAAMVRLAVTEKLV